MRVEVRPHIELRPSLRAWRDGLSVDPARRAMTFDVYWSGMVDQVVAAGGPPAGAVVVPKVKRLTFWMELTGGTWVKLVAEPDRWEGLLFTLVREFVVTEMTPLPPRAGTPH